jgi:hypothetical protein
MMLSEHTKITLRNALGVLLALGGLIYGYAVTIGQIHSRLTVLEASDNAKEKKLDDIYDSQRRQEDKLDRLLERMIK